MWDRVFPLILEDTKMSPQDKEHLIKTALQTMQQVKRGGPDLVKVNFNPLEAIETSPHWGKLKKFNTGQNDSQGNPITYNLLANPDGIICWPQANGTIRFFYANSDTETIMEVFPTIHPEDEAAFAALKKSINCPGSELVDNSSKRTSDAEHKLIAKIFGKKIERNGIHYELRYLKTREDNTQYYAGMHYDDTHDGCNRLINAYRKYLEIYDISAPNNQWNIIDAALL